MSKHHFSIVYDTEDKEFHYEEMAQEAIYLPQTDEWIRPNTNSDDPYLSKISFIDEQAVGVLKMAISLINKLGKQEGAIQWD